EFHKKLVSDNADVVYGIHKQRTQQPVYYRLFSALYYLLVEHFMGVKLSRNLITMRLMSRRYVDALVQHQERVFIIAGLWAITGFKQISIDVDKGYKGQSTYNLRRRLNTTLYSIVAFSNKPLIYIAILGFMMTASALIYVAGVLIQYFFLTGFGVDGWTSLTISVWFFSGLIIFVLGIIATYISVIFTEVKQRPYSIVRAIHEYQPSHKGENITMTDSTSPDNQAAILAQVNAYYSEKVKAHGATASGVDWNSNDSQELRFRELLRLHPDKSQKFSLLDYGCGYGAMATYMKDQGYDFDFYGYDISAEMIAAAQQAHPDAGWQFNTDFDSLPKADYVISSGIFNVRFDIASDTWKQYMLATVHRMWDASSAGIGFNVLTSYSDAEYMRDDLYYADPLFWFDYCKRNFSKQVTLLHDYGLYEFTLLVRADS
ncbi:MAG: methyltransferase domain-containing protein, partial [Aggregatilineales bacterium]